MTLLMPAYLFGMTPSPPPLMAAHDADHDAWSGILVQRGMTRLPQPFPSSAEVTHRRA